jgi:hypothetical protein
LKCIPQSLLLVFSSFKGSHTGSRIASALDKAISEFGLQSKVVYCAYDNASNMIKAFSVLNELAAVDDIDNYLSFQDDNDDDIPLATYANVIDDEDFGRIFQMSKLMMLITVSVEHAPLDFCVSLIHCS